MTAADAGVTSALVCFRRCECWTLFCSSCGTGAFDDDSSDWAGIAHFDSMEQAAAIAQEDGYGWFVGKYVAYCRTCLEKFGCLIEGHQWRGWRDHVSDRYVGRIRSCDRCSEYEYDPPLPDRGLSTDA